jgi:rod shape-determining protein MreC
MRIPQIIRRWVGPVEGSQTLLRRMLVGGLVMVAAALLVLAKIDLQVLAFLSDRAGDVSAPVLRVLNAPLAAARHGADRLGRLLALEAENERLREENRRLLAWQAEATRLSVQNEALREVLRVPRVEAAPVWTNARIVGDSGSSFVQSRLIDAGSDRGVAPGMAVLTEAGMVGRVVRVGRSTARILLVTDFSSRIPVIVEGSRERAILQGDNGPLPTLQFLSRTARIAIGERVLTSGDGGVLPAGLLVGEVAAVQQGRIDVRPLVDWSRLDWVAVLRAEAPAEPEDEAGPDVASGLRY